MKHTDAKTIFHAVRLVNLFQTSSDLSNMSLQVKTCGAFSCIGIACYKHMKATEVCQEGMAYCKVGLLCGLDAVCPKLCQTVSKVCLPTVQTKKKSCV